MILPNLPPTGPTPDVLGSPIVSTLTALDAVLLTFFVDDTAPFPPPKDVLFAHVELLIKSGSDVMKYRFLLIHVISINKVFNAVYENRYEI